MGDSPRLDDAISCGIPGPGGDGVTSSDGEVDPPKRLLITKSKSETKDIGYSSESQSNDETDLMR